MSARDDALKYIRNRVGQELTLFLDEKKASLRRVDEDLGAAIDSIVGLLAGGKRLRAAFCYWGWLGAGGEDGPEITVAAAALELLHACALIHDDVMDDSAERRRRPAVHRQFQARHVAAGWRCSPAAFGVGVAILLGDLLLCWTDEMLRSTGLPSCALQSGQQVLDVMRTEMAAGQYLDLCGRVSGTDSVSSALRIATYKSAKYTVERPLHLGAALAAGSVRPGGPGEAMAAAFSAYGLPLGIAFQIRDDILGTFGDPARSGKPVGDDVRQGKSTILLAVARSRATARQGAVLDRHLDSSPLDEAGAEEVREVIVDTGALAACEEMIEQHAGQAVSALASAPITAQARQALTELATIATARHDLLGSGR